MRGPAQPCVAPSKAGKENKAKQLRKKKTIIISESVVIRVSLQQTSKLQRQPGEKKKKKHAKS
jgi:hypothetical protein